MSPATFPPGVKDELGTEKLFKNMLGKAYTVRGFDECGNVELEPKPLLNMASASTAPLPEKVNDRTLSHPVRWA